MTPSTSTTSAASSFDRALARQLAARIVEGAYCNEPVVRQCYTKARQELQIPAPPADDPFAEEFETSFVVRVVGLMETHQRFLVSMPEVLAAIFIAELVLDKPW